MKLTLTLLVLSAFAVAQPSETTETDSIKFNSSTAIDPPMDLGTSGHSEGTDDTETSAILGNISEQQKNQPTLPTAESLGVGGSKVTDFQVKVPEIKTPESKQPQMAQMQVPDPSKQSQRPGKQDAADAGGGGCST